MTGDGDRGPGVPPGETHEVGRGDIRTPANAADVAARPRAAEGPGGSHVDEAWTEDWQTLIAAGRFTQARAVVRTVGAGAEQVAAVEALADVQELAREKSWPRALWRVERLTELNAPVDVPRLERELRILGDASGQIDRREPEEAMATLADVEEPYLIAEVATQLGTAHVLMNDADAARAQFERALEHDPRHFRAMTNLGNLALEDGEVDAAIAAYEGALRINDGFANAHHNLGVALRRKGKVARSVRSLRRAQKAMQQQDAERARESAKGLPVGRWLRWLLIAGVAVTVYLVLSQRGII